MFTQFTSHRSVVVSRPFSGVRAYAARGAVAVVVLVSSLGGGPAFAHSTGACVNAVVDSCNAQYPNNYQARLACTNSGITQCNGHSHGGGGNGVDSASEDLTSGSGGKERIRIFKKLKIQR